MSYRLAERRLLGVHMSRYVATILVAIVLSAPLAETPGSAMVRRFGGSNKSCSRIADIS
jgi:hypothetical protein